MKWNLITVIVGIMLLSGIVSGCDHYCSDCDTCEANITAASAGETICLNASITDESATCINDPAGFNNKVFDCQGNIIDGDNDNSQVTDYGIYGKDKANITIRNCSISEFHRGIYLDNVDNSIIRNNTIQNNRCNYNNCGNSSGLWLINSDNNSIDGNLIKDSGCAATSCNWGAGACTTYEYSNKGDLYMRESTFNNITDNIFENTIGKLSAGITMCNADKNNLSGNNISGGYTHGILVEYSDSNNITNNIASTTGFGGIGIHFSPYGARYNNIVGNRMCDNSNYDIYKAISGAVSGNSGDNNTCDTGYNWLDDGETEFPCTNFCYTPPVDCTCISCDDCEAKLNDPSCDVVNMTTNIQQLNDSCINDPVNFSNKVFDCKNHHLYGNDTATALNMGIYLKYGRENNTIKNCMISGFYYGIYFSAGRNNTVTNNTIYNNTLHGFFVGLSQINNISNNIIQNNSRHGIYLFSTSSNNIVDENNVCSNNQSGGAYYDIYDEATTNSGDNNTCDTTSGWTDTGTTGCTYQCDGDCNCDNCDDCEERLNDALCSNVLLGSDITDYAGTCINNPADFTNKVFDCQGHIIGHHNKSTGSEYGILAKDKSSITVQNCDIYNFTVGVYINSTNQSQVLSSNFTDNYWGALLTKEGSYDNLFNNLRANGAGFHNTIAIYAGTYRNNFTNLVLNQTDDCALCLYDIETTNRFENITIDMQSGGVACVWLDNVSDAIFQNITCMDSGYDGFWSVDLSNHFHSNITINNMDIINSANYGMELFRLTDSVISNSNISTSVRGIRGKYCTDNQIFNNLADSSTQYGISFSDQSHRNNFTNNTALSNTQGGIVISWYSDDNRLENNTASNNQYDGIIIYHSNCNGNILINNTACDNNLAGSSYFDIKDSGTDTTGDNNTCDTTSNWNDTGVTGCTFSCDGTTAKCGDCDDCEIRLNETYSIVNLSADISDYAGTCIDNPDNFTNKIFDCQRHRIDGDDTGTDYGISIIAKDNNSINNCIITDFYDGVLTAGSYGNNITNNNISSNTFVGIVLATTNATTMVNNTFCGNTQYDITALTVQLNLGDNNTCDTTFQWNDAGTLGCTWICSGVGCDQPITEDKTLSTNLVCLQDGPYFAADDIKLNCMQYTITGSGDYSGIIISGYDNNEILNCSPPTNFQYPIYLNDSSNTLLNFSETTGEADWHQCNNKDFITRIQLQLSYGRCIWKITGLQTTELDSASCLFEVTDYSDTCKDPYSEAAPWAPDWLKLASYAAVPAAVLYAIYRGRNRIMQGARWIGKRFGRG